jgi:hypothetical protein
MGAVNRTVGYMVNDRLLDLVAARKQVEGSMDWRQTRLVLSEVKEDNDSSIELEMGFDLPLPSSL